MENGGFLGKYFISASIFFVACEHLGRLFQPSLKYLQVKPIWGQRVSRSGQSAFAI